MDEREYSYVTYNEHCASCHGVDLLGTKSGSNLLADPLQYGDSTGSLILSISENITAHQNLQLPTNPEVKTIRSLALYITERRLQYPTISESYAHDFEEKVVESQHHSFKIEKFADLQSRPYSIAPLPDGRILVTEKSRGLSIVSVDGNQGALISQSPEAYPETFAIQWATVSWGQMLEVALHPNYETNGWVYLSFADRCKSECMLPIPQSMVKVVRGRISEGTWTDEETIWSVHSEYYTPVPDGVAGGRLGFDKNGHIYISVGGKASYKHLHDMNTPYGKIHRVKDDGSAPEENPFWLPADEREGSSTRHTVWSYGHRTAQGLEGHPVNGEIWSAEMGPRGGDEINKIMGSGNYGWPLYTYGLDYDSREVSIGEDLGLDFPIEETVLPVVDFTPAPALSNLTFHHGDQFPNWGNDILVGSLKAMTLYRLRIEDGELIENEALVTKLGRIRDIEMGSDGLVYVAIEHGDSGSIVRLIPQQ